jgi:hypothetical protein
MPESARRRFPPLETHGDLAERQLRIEVVRLEGGRLAVGVERVLHVAERRVGGPELQVRVEVVGLVGDDAGVGLDRLVGLAQALIGGAELKAGVGVVGIDEKARLQQVEELLQLFGLAHGR